MRAVVQRVLRASVTVDGKVVGAIDGPGLLVYLGVTHADGPDEIVVDRRARSGTCGSCATSGRPPTCAAPVLVVSQFTLYGDARKGRRPTWQAAAPGEVSEPLYDAFCAELERLGAHVERGRVRRATCRVELGQRRTDHAAAGALEPGQTVAAAPAPGRTSARSAAATRPRGGSATAVGSARRRGRRRKPPASARSSDARGVVPRLGPCE